MALPYINEGDTIAAVKNKIDNIIDSAGLDSTENTNTSEARSLLNDVAALFDKSTFANNEGGLSVRNKINALADGPSFLPSPDVDLYIDFLEGEVWSSGLVTLPDILTDTHAATIRADDSDGVYNAFAPNTIVLTDLGLQSVPTRTNNLRNSSAGGAVVGTPGTLPTSWSNSGLSTLIREIVAIGTENGLPYVDIRLSGTPTTSGVAPVVFETQSHAPASSGQVWTGSVFMKIVAGSVTGFSSIQFRPARGYVTGGGTSADASQVTITGDLNSTLTRFARTATLTDATTAFIAPQVLFNFTNGVAVDITVRFAAPQLELGAFASPPILTTTADATVNGNQQVIAGLGSQLANGVAGFIQVDASRQPALDFKVLMALSNGTTGTDILLCATTVGNLSYQVRNATVNQAVMSAPGGWPTDITTIAFSAGPNYANVRRVGQAALPADIVVTYPSVDRIAFGGFGHTVTQNSYGITKKLALKFGPQNQASFDEMFALAEAAA